MKRAANELQDPTFLPSNKHVKFDGLWQKRGHASLNGVETTTVEDKCVDYQVLTKHCSGVAKCGKQRKINLTTPNHPG